MQKKYDWGDNFMTSDEVAELLQINKGTVSRMARDGRLPATRVGKQWRFRRVVINMLFEP